MCDCPCFQEQNLKKEQILQVNPHKFDKMDDMSNLTYLNDATVLWNLKDRYYNQLIYVSSNPILQFDAYIPIAFSSKKPVSI